MAFIKVDVSDRTIETSEANPEDSWDRPDTSTDWSINGLRIVEKDGYRVHEVPYAPVIGSPHYLVFAIYSSGDSFGHDESGGFEIIGIYDNPELARDAADAAKGNGQFINEAGKKYEAYRPWDGYFESLTTLEVRPFLLGV